MGNSSGRPVVITDEVKLEHFKLLRVVGKGAFGKVRIVERKDTGLTFALKYIRKDEVVRSENVRNIVRERRMLEHLNHPFLCNLRYSFQDYEYIYLVVDLMNGGDLRFHISRKTFTEDAVRFWIAELGCAIRYIHSQGVVHRDVKPDNVLLDSHGHVHLADFNVASDFRPGKPLTSKSGTLAYLAPEIYEGMGYLSEVDWWSLGVLFYECIYNKRPFEGHNHEDLANRIKAASPKYPTTNPPVSTACSSAIKALLSKNLPDRIGANGFDNFKTHPFLYPIDFTELERLHVPPVFVPSAEKTNFDATYDLEELLLEESPLEARMKHQKPRPALKADATPRERRQEELHRMIEQYFEPFDYTAATFKEGNVFDRPADSSTDESSRPGMGQSRMSQSSTTSPTDQTQNLYSHTRPTIHDRTTSRSRSRAVSRSGTNTEATGSPPLTSQVSMQNLAIRTKASSSDMYHAQSLAQAMSSVSPSDIQGQGIDITAQANAIAAAASAVGVPPNQQTPNLRPSPGPRSKSVSNAQLRRSNAGPGAGALARTGTSWSSHSPSDVSRPGTGGSAGAAGVAGQGPGPATPQSDRRSRAVLSADNLERMQGSSSARKEKDGGMGGSGKKSGFLGMLGSKKGGSGRGRSPKRMEPGVLGKEGARVVVGD